MTSRLSYETFKYIYQQVPRLAVEVVLLDDDGSILLTQRKGNGWDGLWHTPGGTVLYRESVQNAVIRIAHDELGIDAEVLGCVGYFEAWSEEKERGYGYSVSLPFLVRTHALNVVLNDDATSWQFFSEMPMNSVPEHRAFYSSVQFKTAVSSLSSR